MAMEPAHMKRFE